MSTPCRSELESTLSSLSGAKHAVTYSSGQSASFALMVALNPKRVFIHSAGYHGTHCVLDILSRLSPIEIKHIEFNQAGLDLRQGDLLWLESPQNPKGILWDISLYRQHGVIIAVDSTILPFPLYDPFKYGADIVMHSCTKYLGGHSDLLGGVLLTNDEGMADQVHHSSLCR